MKILVRSLLAAVGLVLAVGTTSHAGLLDVVAGTLSYRDVGTINNNLRISSSGGLYSLSDPADLNLVISQNVINAGCFVGVLSIMCPATSITAISVDAGNGADTVDLTGMPIPSSVVGGPGADRLVGGDAGDSFYWRAGDGVDDVDAGPGADAIVVIGAAGNETFVVSADGTGFRVVRDFINVWIKGISVEDLWIDAGPGTDSVYTVLFPSVVQHLQGGTQPNSERDVIGVDGQGGCPWFEIDYISLPDRQPAFYDGFESNDSYNYVCGAIVTFDGGVLGYQGQNNQHDLRLTRSGSTYTLHDPIDQAITPSPQARAAGCANVTPNTVTCPTAPITSFEVYMGGGNDKASFAGAQVPVVFTGDAGNDTYIGGESDDVFMWIPNAGNGSDTIDGGPGNDTLEFTGSDHNETYSVAKDGPFGFRLHRNIEDVTMLAQGLEVLEIDVKNGNDSISTVSLRNTEQRFSGNPYPSVTSLRVDADGRCLVNEGDRLTTPGRPPIVMNGVDFLDITNYSCRQDACALPSTYGCKVNGVPNQPCDGTSGNDSIVGTPGPDVIHAGDGRDKVSGRGGDDILCGEGGDDKLSGSAGEDTLDGGPGRDTLSGGSGPDLLIGGDDEDTLKSGSGNDTLDGGAGNDRLKAGGDADYLDGGADLDVLDGGGTKLDICNDADQLGPFKGCEM